MVDYLTNRWFYWKIFRTKVAWLEEGHMIKMWTWPWVTLSIRSLSFSLNENPYFLLHILVAYLENFPKHYDKVTFHWVLFELWSLKAVPLALSIYACACERDSYARASPRSIHIAWYMLTRTELSPILPNWTIQLSSFFHIAFSFNFFTLVGFFKTFFKMAIYSSNDWYYFCLVKTKLLYSKKIVS